MDPNANLEEQRELVSQIISEYDKVYPDFGRLADLGKTLADLVESMDQWISKGGFLPKSWERK